MNEKKPLDTFGPSLLSNDDFAGQHKKERNAIKKEKKAKKKLKNRLKVALKKQRRLKQKLNLQAQLLEGKTQLLRTEIELDFTKKMLLAVLQQKDIPSLPFLSLPGGEHHE